MPRAEEIAKAMAEMDRYNQPRATVVEERYEKRVASVGGSYGGLAELMSQGRPGNWASDHKAEAEKYAGWHYVAISAIGKAIRSCDVEAYQEPVREYSKAYNAEDDDSAPLPKWHPLMKLLKRPSQSQSGASFREEVAIQLCLTGSALIWNVPNQMGRTVERYVIPTAIAEPRQPEKGLPKGGWYINPEVARWQVENGWFLYTGLAQAIGKVIDARDVQVIRFIHPTFKDEGQSPVSAGALWTDTSEKIDVSRHAHLRNGSDPSVIIGIDGVEDESTLQRMSAKFNEKYAGPSKHGKAMFVNGQNVKVEPVTRTPAEMAYEGAFAQFRDAIMALHGVTPIAAGIEAPSGDDGLYAPLKQFIAGTVQPILDLMAEEDTEQLASQFGEGLTIFYTARAIDDAKLTEQQINTDIAAGAIEVDEIRKLRGRKPWGGEKGKAVAGQGPKQEGPGGLPGLPQGVPGLDAPQPPAGPQASDPSQPAQQPKTPEQIAEEAVAKALAAFEDRISSLLKSGSDCGANGPGGGGFQPGNSCASGDGAGAGSEEVSSKVREWAKKKFKDDKVAENFARWFGSSKVVDEDGNPLRVYHGTTADFNEFKPGNPSAAGAGIYFAENPEVANNFSEFRDSGKTYPAYLSIEKPFDFSGANSISEAEGLIEVAKKVSPESFDSSSAFGRYAEPDYKRHLKEGASGGVVDGFTVWDSLRQAVGKENVNKVLSAAGYDGIIHDTRDGAGTPARAGEESNDGIVWVAFSPSQIKSATGNSGAFSPDSRDITKSSGCGANAQGGGGFQPGNTCAREDGAEGGAGESKPKKGKKPTAKKKGILAWAEEKFGDAEKAKAFAAWFGDSKVIDDEGNPEETRPIPVYHGTTHDFEEFDLDRTNPESDMGAGHYFSSDAGDSEANYAGEGPDLTSRIGQLADKIEGDIGDEYDAEYLADTLELPVDRVEEIIEQGEDDREVATLLAKEKLVGGEGKVITAYLKMDKPVVLGDPKWGKEVRGAEKGETFFDFEYDERDSEGRTPDDPDFDQDSAEIQGYKGKLADLLDAVRNQAGNFNEVGDGLEDDLAELQQTAADYGGFRAGELVSRLKSMESLAYATDDDGRLVSGNIVSQALREIGFDGIIYKDASKHFENFGARGNGEKIKPGTRHYIVWDSRQIKSVENQGTFDPSNPNIYKSGSDCGANAEGGGGFQPGNTCARGGGSGEPDRNKISEGVKKVRKWEESLNARQKAMVWGWGGSGLRIRLNQAANGGELPDWAKGKDEYKVSADDLKAWSEILDSAPKFDGTVYRGLHSVKLDEARNIVNSGEITLKNDQSSTWDKSVSDKWVGNGAGKDDARIELIIDQKSGAWVEDATRVYYGDDPQSGAVNESEVILRKGTTYKVQSVEFVRSNGEVLTPDRASEVVESRISDEVNFRKERVENTRKRIAEAEKEELHPSVLKRLRADLESQENDLRQNGNADKIKADWMPHVDLKGFYRIRMVEK